MAFCSSGGHQPHRQSSPHVNERRHTEAVCDAVGLCRSQPRHDVRLHMVEGAVADPEQCRFAV